MPVLDLQDGQLLAIPCIDAAAQQRSVVSVRVQGIVPVEQEGDRCIPALLIAASRYRTGFA